MKRALLTLVALCACVAFARAYAGGEDDFTKNCVSCHGKDGKGKTTMGARLNIKDLSDAKVQASFTDDQAVKAVTDGIKDEKTGKVLMPSKKDKLSPDQIKDVVAYIRTLKGA